MRMNTQVKPTWAQRVEEILEAQGRLRVWLAREIEMDFSQLSRMMAGDPRYHIKPEFRAKVARALRVPERLLFGANGQHEAQP